MSEETSKRLPMMVRWLLDVKESGSSVLLGFRLFGLWLLLVVLITFATIYIMGMYDAHEAWLSVSPFLVTAIMVFLIAFNMMHPAISAEDRKSVIKQSEFVWFFLLLLNVLGFLQWFDSLVGNKPWYIDIAIKLGLILGFFIFAIILPAAAGQFLGRRRPTPNS